MTETINPVTDDVANREDFAKTTNEAEQPQGDPATETPAQSEQPQSDETEEERLAKLDMETEDDRANKPLDAEVWGSTGHAVADEAMRTLQNVGLSTDDAQELLLEAALSRDPSKVDQKALAAKIGPRRAKAIMQSLETFSRDMRPNDERIANEVYQHTNGPNAYRRLMEQAGEILPEAEFLGYLTQVGKGGSTAQRAIEALQARVTGKALSPDRRVLTQQYAPPKPIAAPEKSEGITSKAYFAAMDAMHSTGNRLSFEARDRKIAELREARRIGREAGLP